MLAIGFLILFHITCVALIGFVAIPVCLVDDVDADALIIALTMALDLVVSVLNACCCCSGCCYCC